ncbi:TPA: helix-turn-helix transcriptional regulator, partial [Klebsiella variicola]
NNSGDFFMKLRKREDKIQMLLLKCFEEDIANEVNSKIKLTLREQEVLRWLGLGKTYNEISLICEISERTVRFHLVNILKKLDANNTRYALAKAALYGLL